MKQPKPMNRQLSLSLGLEPPACEIASELALQQQQDIESALADLLLTVAANVGIHRGGDDDR
jgi:hypothetical protein